VEASERASQLGRQESRREAGRQGGRESIVCVYPVILNSDERDDVSLCKGYVYFKQPAENVYWTQHAEIAPHTYKMMIYYTGMLHNNCIYTVPECVYTLSALSAQMYTVLSNNKQRLFAGQSMCRHWAHIHYAGILCSSFLYTVCTLYQHRGAR
jgi:hypothetical protein